MFAFSAEKIPAISNYGQALMRWERAKPWRNEPAPVRPLEDRKKHHCAIIKHEGHIVCRFHRTELVTYYEDGRVDVYVNYDSISTDNFIGALLRHSPVIVRVNQAHPVVWRCDPTARYWGAVNGQCVDGGTARFDADWNLLNPKPIRTVALNKTIAKKLRDQYKVSDFAAWRTAYEGMNGHPDFGWRSRNSKTYRPNAMARDWVMEAIADRSKWVELSRTTTTDYVLQTIYETHPECVATGEIERFHDYRAYENWKALDRKYGHLVR